MGNFRFYKRVHIFPGLSINLSKSVPSFTMGVRGAHITLGPNGIRKTLGIPGTGIYYSSRTGHYTGIHTAHVESIENDPILNQKWSYVIGGILIIMIFIKILTVII